MDTLLRRFCIDDGRYNPARLSWSRQLGASSLARTGNRMDAVARTCLPGSGARFRLSSALQSSAEGISGGLLLRTPVHVVRGSSLSMLVDRFVDS